MRYGNGRCGGGFGGGGGGGGASVVAKTNQLGFYDKESSETCKQQGGRPRVGLCRDGARSCVRRTHIRYVGGRVGLVESVREKELR